MKRSEFIRQLLVEGCILLRHGAKHDIYINPATNKKQTVQGITEIDETLSNILGNASNCQKANADRSELHTKGESTHA